MPDLSNNYRLILLAREGMNVELPPACQYFYLLYLETDLDLSYPLSTPCTCKLLNSMIMLYCLTVWTALGPLIPLSFCMTVSGAMLGSRVRRNVAATRQVLPRPP